MDIVPSGSTTVFLTYDRRSVATILVPWLLRRYSRCEQKNIETICEDQQKTEKIHEEQMK